MVLKNLTKKYLSMQMSLKNLKTLQNNLQFFMTYL